VTNEFIIFDFLFFIIIGKCIVFKQTMYPLAQKATQQPIPNPSFPRTTPGALDAPGKSVKKSNIQTNEMTQ